MPHSIIMFYPDVSRIPWWVSEGRKWAAKSYTSYAIGMDIQFAPTNYESFVT